jgi:hypothetical protein
MPLTLRQSPIAVNLSQRHQTRQKRTTLEPDFVVGSGGGKMQS